MTSPPEFLDLEDVLDLHRQALERFGGTDGIRDLGALESAIGTPRTSFGGQFLHADVFEMGAAYAFHIAQSQAFLDGNKRTGLLAALVFLEWNGFDVTDPRCELYEAMIAIAERRLDKKALAELLRSLAAPRPAR